jgi:hypothetical protein
MVMNGSPGSAPVAVPVALVEVELPLPPELPLSEGELDPEDASPVVASLASSIRARPQPIAQNITRDNEERSKTR